jgi:hypothetical protein
LAGSERAAKTKNIGQRMIEGANINRRCAPHSSIGFAPFAGRNPL